MSAAVLTLRDDSIAVAGSRALAPILAWSECRYGESVDAAEPCTLRLKYDDPIFDQMTARQVLYLKNEIDAVYEYRIKKIDNDRSRPTRRIEAVPILHDLNDVLLTTITPGGIVPIVTGTYTVAEWWTYVIGPALARKGMTHWQLGAVDLDDSLTFTLVNESVLSLLRRFTDGTVLTLRARLSGGVYYVDLTTPTAAYRPLVLVGTNVLTLESEVDSDLQVTRVYPNGQAYPNGTPSGIGGTPWTIGAGVGLGVEILDPEYGTADFAIETDQFAPNVAAGFEGYAMIASRGTEVMTVPTVGAAGGFGINCAVAAGRKIYVAYDVSGGTAEVYVYDYANQAWNATSISMGDDPQGMCFVPSVGCVYVACAASANVKVINITTDTVTATITGVGTPYRMFYDATVDRIFIATTGGLVTINPNTNTVVSTTTGGTTNGIQDLCPVSASGEIWAVENVSGYVHRYTLAASPAYVGEYTTGLEGGAGASALAYDAVNDRVWVSFWGGSPLKMKVLTRATGAIAATLNVDTNPNAGYVRYINCYGGTIFTAHTGGKIARWSGSAMTYTDVTVVDATLSDIRVMPLIGPGESSMFLLGTGKKLGWWDMQTNSARVVRRIAGVTAGSPSVVQFNGGVSAPFATGDFTTMVTLDLLPVVSLLSPLAIALYGEIERAANFPNARLVPNLVGHPGLDDWKTPGTAMANWDLPSPVTIGRDEAEATMALGLSITFSGTATRTS